MIDQSLFEVTIEDIKEFIKQATGKEPTIEEVDSVILSPEIDYIVLAIQKARFKNYKKGA